MKVTATGRKRALVPLLSLLSSLSPRLVLAEDKPRPLRLRSTRLTVGDGLLAEGDVLLRRGRCSLEAGRLRIGREQLAAEGACLRRRGQELLRAVRLRWSLRKGALVAHHAEATVCRCFGAPLRIESRAVRVYAGGRRVHLSWPVLRLGRLPLLALPYMALPLRPGTSGLLAPRLGYSGRDGLRLEQGGYLAAGTRADLLAAAGWVQRRGARGRARLRYFSARGDGELRLLAQHDDSWRGWARGRLSLRGAGWELSASPELLSDGELLSDLEGEPELVFAPYRRSRFWGRVRWGPLSLLSQADIYQRTVAGGSLEGAMIGRGAMMLLLDPAPLGGPFYALGGAAIQLLERGRSQRDAGLLVAPRLAMAGRLGSMRGSLFLGYRLAALLSSASAELGRGITEQAALLAGEVAFPLARAGRLAGRIVRHSIEPFAGWQTILDGGRWGALATGAARAARSGLVLFGLQRQAASHRAIVGLRSRLSGRSTTLIGGSSLAEAEAKAMLGAGGRHLVGGRARFSAGGASGLIELLYESLEERFPLIQAELCARTPGRGLGLCGGYLRQRATGLEALAWQTATSWHSDPIAGAIPEIETDQVKGEISLRIGPVELWGGVFVDPERRVVTHARYGLGLGGACRCLGLKLIGRSRRDQRWPDLMLSVALEPGAGWRDCLGI